MNYLVTGAAGFIGSHLAASLLLDGHTVVAVDGFTEFYGVPYKALNALAVFDAAAEAQTHGTGGRLAFVLADLRRCNVEQLVAHPVLAGRPIDVVYHLAGQPGVRGSFGPLTFGDHVSDNITVTHRMLEACGRATGLFVFASSSSVYFADPDVPMSEFSTPTIPSSPYGASKLCAELLCRMYATTGRCRAMAVRLFTVYGQRQRPDMAFARLCESAWRGTPFVVRGSGHQTRDFTYVGDAVRRLVRCGERGHAAAVVNLGSGKPQSLNDAIAVVQDLIGDLRHTKVAVSYERAAAEDGEARATCAETTHMVRLLEDDADQVTPLREGLTAQLMATRRRCELIDSGRAQRLATAAGLGPCVGDASMRDVTLAPQMLRTEVQG